MTSSHETDLRIYSGERIVLGILGGSERETENFVSLSLNYVRNLGAAWGMLNNLPDTIRDPFFTIVMIIALFVFFHFFKSAAPDNRLLQWAIALIVSGAIGNYLNRIVYGYVIDWIDVRWNVFGWRYAFPNFNWADSAITIGVGILLFEQFYVERKRKKKPLNESVVN